MSREENRLRIRAAFAELDRRAAETEANAAAQVRDAYEIGMQIGFILCGLIVAGFFAIVFKVAGWW